MMEHDRQWIDRMLGVGEYGVDPIGCGGRGSGLLEDEEISSSPLKASEQSGEKFKLSKLTTGTE
jgi:hypothetical protein